MQSFWGSLIRRQSITCIGHGLSSLSSDSSKIHLFRLFHQFATLSPLPLTKLGSHMEKLTLSDSNVREFRLGLHQLAVLVPPFKCKSMTTLGAPVESASQDSSAPVTDVPPHIKFKRLDKTAGNIMRILDNEAVQEVKAQRDIPDIKPGYIVQLKVEVPENKRRVSIVKGVVIARHNAGLNTTFRLRRQVAGVGVESLFPLYSPNIKEIKVLDKKKVRRAKLYYLREKMNALKK